MCGLLRGTRSERERRVALGPPPRSFPTPVPTGSGSKGLSQPACTRHPRFRLALKHVRAEAATRRRKGPAIRDAAGGYRDMVFAFASPCVPQLVRHRSLSLRASLPGTGRHHDGTGSAPEPAFSPSITTLDRQGRLDGRAPCAEPSRREPAPTNTTPATMNPHLDIAVLHRLGCVKPRQLWHIERVAEHLANGEIGFQPTRLIALNALRIPKARLLSIIRRSEKSLPGWESESAPWLSHAEREGLLEGCEALLWMAAGREGPGFEHAALVRWRHAEALMRRPASYRTATGRWRVVYPHIPEPHPSTFSTPMRELLRKRRNAFADYVSRQGRVSYQRTWVHSGHAVFIDKTLFLATQMLRSTRRHHDWVAYFLCDTRKPSFRFTEHSPGRLRLLLDLCHAHYDAA